jgi:ribosomal protein L19E
MQFTRADLDQILESLSYSKQRMEDYPRGPGDSYEAKRARLDRIEALIDKVRACRKEQQD